MEYQHKQPRYNKAVTVYKCLWASFKVIKAQFLLSAPLRTKEKVIVSPQSDGLWPLLKENVRLREWVNTEYVWEFKRGFGKTSLVDLSRAVRFRECCLESFHHILYIITSRVSNVGLVWCERSLIIFNLSLLLCVSSKSNRGNFKRLCLYNTLTRQNSVSHQEKTSSIYITLVTLS